MEIYKVGGCVRDFLLGIDSKDIDYVVVNSSENEMLNLGYSKVGNDFPVFLHPETGSEYALARKERKTGAGYNGFTVDTEGVSLKDDLFRRDLTINSMALDSNGNIIDYFGGQDDLKNKILRHVSVHFAEDPVRILRICRFSARYNFSIDPSTVKMMKEMVKNGEFDSLTAERVWKEFDKAFSENYLNNFFKYLEEIGAREKLVGLNKLENLDYFSYIKEKSNNIYLSNALFVLSNVDKNFYENWTIPTDLVKKVNHFNNFKNVDLYSEMSPKDKLNFIQEHRALHDVGLSDLLDNLFNICLYKSFKENNDYDFEYQKNIILNDIQKLKGLDFSNANSVAKSKNLKIQDYIYNEKLNIFKKENKFKHH